MYIPDKKKYQESCQQALIMAWGLRTRQWHWGIHLICRMQSGPVNKTVQAFWDSDKEDEVISYIPSSPVKFESKKQGYDMELNPVELRLALNIMGLQRA